MAFSASASLRAAPKYPPKYFRTARCSSQDVTVKSLITPLDQEQRKSITRAEHYWTCPFFAIRRHRLSDSDLSPL